MASHKSLFPLLVANHDYYFIINNSGLQHEVSGLRRCLIDLFLVSCLKQVRGECL